MVDNKVSSDRNTPLRPEIDIDSSAMLEAVIKQLQQSGASIDSETLMMVMLKNLMQRIAKENGKDIDLSNLTEAQEQQLEAALEAIAAKIQQAGVMTGVDLRKLVRLLIHSHTKRKGREKDREKDGQEKDDDFESLSPKEKKRLKELFKLFAMYEAYKVTNPNQLAGETREANFVNNLHMYGKDFALKKAGSDMGIDEKTLNEMEKNRHSFVEGLQNFNKGKDTGWSR